MVVYVIKCHNLILVYFSVTQHHKLNNRHLFHFHIIEGGVVRVQRTRACNGHWRWVATLLSLRASTKQSMVFKIEKYMCTKPKEYTGCGSVLSLIQSEKYANQIQKSIQLKP